MIKINEKKSLIKDWINHPERVSQFDQRLINRSFNIRLQTSAFSLYRFAQAQ